MDSVVTMVIFHLEEKKYLEMGGRSDEWSSVHQKELICSTNKVKSYVAQNCLLLLLSQLHPWGLLYSSCD